MVETVGPQNEAFAKISGLRLSIWLCWAARRYERAPFVLTSNKSFVDWGEICSDPVLATTISGEGYRLVRGSHPHWTR